MSYNVGKSNGKYKHGKTDSPEYKVWNNMLSRTTNPNHPRYKDWGGRGVTVVDKWLTFTGFYEDMGERPSPKHTLERRDNTLGYSKENCYWATTKEQALNRRSTRNLTYMGITQPMYTWAQVYGIKYVTLCSRKLRGWSDAEAIEGVRHGLKTI